MTSREVSLLESAALSLSSGYIARCHYEEDFMRSVCLLIAICFIGSYVPFAYASNIEAKSASSKEERRKAIAKEETSKYRYFTFPFSPLGRAALYFGLSLAWKVLILCLIWFTVLIVRITEYVSVRIRYGPDDFRITRREG